MWSRFFKSQDYNMPTYKYKDLPIYITEEFDFYRCLEFSDMFYGKTVSELHRGNLRLCTGRYSKLFPGKKLSYWADSKETARAEVKKHGSSNRLLTFWAYDDCSSFFPTTQTPAMLKIIDGREMGIQSLIDKVDEGKEISKEEYQLLQKIMAANPDCITFDSHAHKGGENFIFFESGFAKLSLREVNLRLGNNSNCITCAFDSDYTPCPDKYGEYFEPICKIKMDKTYLDSEEYKKRMKYKSEHFNERI